MPQKTYKSIVYIDGLNLYYGALKGGQNKWLDLQRYFRLLRPHDDIQEIFYFTTRVSGKSQADQKAYLSALASLPLVTTVEGRFKPRRLRCLVRRCTLPGDRTFTRLEEKRTDVNIAVHMLEDAFADRCDAFVLVTGDSDLVPAVTSIKRNFPHKKVYVYVPSQYIKRSHAVELRNVADRHWNLHLQVLRHAQLPATLPDGAGGTLTKPADW